jgi:hypothetical protein
MADTGENEMSGSQMGHKKTAAEAVGCCLASSKEDCKRPPCPCNWESWSEGERRAIVARRRKKAA